MNKKQVPEKIRCYFAFKEEMTVEADLIWKSH